MKNDDGTITVEMDACVDIKEDGIHIDPNGENESGDFLEVMNENGVTYKVTDPEGPGGGWPQIEFTGQKAGLVKFLTQCLNAGAHSEKETARLFEEWDGDDEELYEIIC